MNTRQLPSQQRLRELLDYNPQNGKLYWRERGLKKLDSRRAGQEAFTATTPKGYRRGMIEGIQYRAHRVIYKWVHDDEPEEIDHINGIRDDNRIANLRPSTRRENLLNSINAKRKAALDENNITESRNKSGGWIAKISFENENRYLGTYSTKSEAQAAVSGALRLLASMK